MINAARAAVFHAAGRPLELRDVAIPELSAGELLVRVRLTTLCGSDLHTHCGSRSTPVPTILGHEIIGDVVAVGGRVAKLDLSGQAVAVGDRITWSIAAHCGSCFYCANGLPQKCEHLFKYGHERLTAEHSLSGGLATHCHLTPSTPVLVLPDQLADEVACLANCATATAAGALRIGELSSCDKVLVFGAGMLGLTMAAMARSAGAKDVIVVDVSRDRLARATRFGANHTIFAPSALDLPAAVSNVTGGRGADLALEASGAPEAMESAMSSVRIGGRIVFVGAVRPTRPIAIDGEQIVRRVLTLRGLHNYIPDDLRAAVDFLARSEAPFADFVSPAFSLSDAEAAFAAARTNGALRTAVKPE